MWTVCVTLICIEKKHKPQNVDSLCKVISRTFTKVRNCLRKIEKWYKNSNNCGAFCSLRGFKRGSFAFVFCLVFLLGGGGMGFVIVKDFFLHDYMQVSKISYQLWYSLLDTFSEQKATTGGWDHLAYYLCRIIVIYESPANSILTALNHCYWYKLINQYHIEGLLCKTLFPHLGFDDMNIVNPELMKSALLYIV